jgi:hypothetical protein
MWSCIVRTVPEKLYEFAPRGDFRIIEAYLRALRSAQQVYLENQFLWSPGDREHPCREAPPTAGGPG